MRTTLTLDDDLAQRLKELSRESGRSFKDVTNSALRRGLSAGDAPVAAQEPFEVRAQVRGFRAGIDPLKLNQTYDELEVERLRSDAALGVHEP
jgi:predicted transcriptional regulator